MYLKGRGRYLYLFPAILLLAGVTIYPLIYVIWLSLHRLNLVSGITIFIGVDNFLYLWKDQRFWNALENTLYFTTVSVAIEIALGLAIALLLNRSFFGKGVVTSIVLVPWAVPTVVSAKVWEWMYNTDYGILNFLLGLKINWLGSPSWALNSAIFMDVWKSTPFVALILLAALKTIPLDLYRAARVDGASPLYVFRYITLPLLKSAILIVLIFRTLDAFRVFDAIYVLTGGGPANTTETLSIYAYKVLFQMMNFGYGSAISLTVFVSVGFITVLYIRLLRGAR